MGIMYEGYVPSTVPSWITAPSSVIPLSSSANLSLINLKLGLSVGDVFQQSNMAS